MKRKKQGRDENDDSNKIPSKLDPMIPFDLEIEILTRLPAKSLIKFRCVSKIWSSFTRTQRFIDSFHSISSTRPRFMIAVGGGKHLNIFSSSQEGEASSSLVAKLDMVILTPSVNMSFLYVHGYFGSSWGSSFTICNPTSGQVFTFPCKGTRSFLGYDPINGQFKALVLMRSADGGFLFEAHEVITLGGAGGETRNGIITSLPHCPLSKGLYINGFIYYGALFRVRNPMIVCFDVRYEKLSFITTPNGVLCAPGGVQQESMLIEYKGKLASIVPHGYANSFPSFDLWILEDVTKHDWSKQIFGIPLSFQVKVTSPGTNKAGEIIFAPETLPYTAQPFYIYYYNVERNDIRRFQIHGIADNEGFRNRYGLIDNCRVYISPQHVESIASF